MSPAQDAASTHAQYAQHNIPAYTPLDDLIVAMRRHHFHTHTHPTSIVRRTFSTSTASQWLYPFHFAATICVSCLDTRSGHANEVSEI